MIFKASFKIGLVIYKATLKIALLDWCVGDQGFILFYTAGVVCSRSSLRRIDCERVKDNIAIQSGFLPGLNVGERCKTRTYILMSGVLVLVIKNVATMFGVIWCGEETWSHA